MNAENTNHQKKMLQLCEELLAVEEERLRGNIGYSVDEVITMMRTAIKEFSPSA